MYEISDQYISPEATTVLQEMGYTIQGPNSDGYLWIEVPASDISSWESEDNGGSYEIVIKGRKFWQNAPDRTQFGLQLEGSQESNRIAEESRKRYEEANRRYAGIWDSHGNKIK